MKWKQGEVEAELSRAEPRSAHVLVAKGMLASAFTLACVSMRTDSDEVRRSSAVRVSLRTRQRLWASANRVRGRPRSQKETVALPHVHGMSNLGAPETRFACLASDDGQGGCDLIHALPAGEAPPLTPLSLFSPSYLVLTCTCKRIPLAVSRRRYYCKLSTSKSATSRHEPCRPFVLNQLGG